MIVLESDVSGKELNEGESFTIFDYTVLKDGKEYFDAFHPVSGRKLFGYTSWYNHYQNVSEEKLNEAISRIIGDTDPESPSVRLREFSVAIAQNDYSKAEDIIRKLVEEGIAVETRL